MKADQVKDIMFLGLEVPSRYGEGLIERTGAQAKELLRHVHGEWAAAGGGEICRHALQGDNMNKSQVVNVSCNAEDGSINSITVSNAP